MASLSQIGIQRHQRSGPNRGECRAHTFTFERFVEEVPAFRGSQRSTCESKSENSVE